MTSAEPLARAWAAALRAAASLSRRDDVLGVAVTGSLARGDFCAGSDVDLIVVGRKNARVERRVLGVPLTELWVTHRFLSSTHGLLLFELDDAVILADPRERLAALKDASAARRSELTETASTALLRELVAVATAVGRATTEVKIAALREIARRSACLVVFRARGWRVPRQRQLRRVLSKPSFEQLQSILALPDARPLLPLLLQARRAGSGAGIGLPEPALVRRYVAAGRGDDAVIAIRQGLPPDSSRTSLRTHELPLFRAAHGFVDPPAIEKRGGAAKGAVDVDVLARQVSAFLDGVGALRLEGGVPVALALRSLGRGRAMRTQRAAR